MLANYFQENNQPYLPVQANLDLGNPTFFLKLRVVCFKKYSFEMSYVREFAS